MTSGLFEREREAPTLPDAAHRRLRSVISDMASARVAALRWKMPRTALVMVSRAGLLDAAHRHAEVLGLDDDDDAGGLEVLDDGVGDLGGHTLLDLRPLGEHIHDASELGEPADTTGLARDIGDVRAAHERHQMVLAHRVQRDVADKHHLLVGLVEGHAEVLGGVLAQAREDLFVHVGDAARSIDQPLTLGVFADALQDQADAGFDLLAIHVASSRSLGAEYRRSAGCHGRIGRDLRLDLDLGLLDRRNGT